MIKLTDDQFIEQYRPLLTGDGELVEAVEGTADASKAFAERRLWTMLDVDGDMVLVSGFHLVNRLFHVITGYPYGDEPVEVSWYRRTDALATDGEYGMNAGLNCPRCGSEDMYGSTPAFSSDDPRLILATCRCNSCDAVWQEHYRLEGYSGLTRPTDDTPEGAAP